MKKKSGREKIIILLILSVLVLGCVVTEAVRRKMTSQNEDKKELTLQEETLQEKSNGSQKKVSDHTKVKVLLTTSDFSSIFHDKIRVTSSKPFVVSVNGKEKKYRAGAVFTYRASDQGYHKKRIVIKPSDGARLKVLSIKRQNIHPAYRGALKISWRKKGLLLTNILPIEEYLYAVVPSEISTSDKMDALKAQAVCARSYAYRQIRSSRYAAYHADVEDSVACQVYNNVPENARSRKAVNSTKGMVLTDAKGEVIQTYYYSTSWGYSASGKDVWSTSADISYLPEKLQVVKGSRKRGADVDLSDEVSFKQKIDKPAYDTYDSDSPWYRWHMTVSQKNLSARITNLVEQCYAADEEQILTQTKSGSYRSGAIKPLGKIKKIRVEKREKSGIVTELVLVGEKNVIKVCTQYNIRKVLGSIYETISYDHGKAKTSLNLLPSAAFYVVLTQKHGKPAFMFVGGGFGHGTGMSQSGAAKMAESGMDYKEILAHYFTGTGIRLFADVANR